jgi:hypothetical protein
MIRSDDPGGPSGFFSHVWTGYGTFHLALDLEDLPVFNQRRPSRLIIDFLHGFVPAYGHGWSTPGRLAQVRKVKMRTVKVVLPVIFDQFNRSPVMLHHGHPDACGG